MSFDLAHPAVRASLIDAQRMHQFVTAGWTHTAFPDQPLRASLSILYALSTVNDAVRLVAQSPVPARWDHLDPTMLASTQIQQTVHPPLEGKIAFHLTAAPTRARLDPRVGVRGRRVPLPKSEREAWGRDALANAGLELARLTVTGTQRIESGIKSLPPNQRPTRQSVFAHTLVSYSGSATVIDADKHRHALIHGIGPAKAYGCGLLLTRAIG